MGREDLLISLNKPQSVRMLNKLCVFDIYKSKNKPEVYKKHSVELWNPVTKTVKEAE